MKYRLLFTSIIAGLTMNAQQTATYDFDSLTVGNLSGQDDWKTTLAGTTTDIQVQAASSHDGTNGIKFTKNGGGVNASFNRPFNNSFPGFSMNDTSSVYTIYVDIKREYWGAEFGIGYDANNDGRIDQSGNTTEKAIRFKFASSTNGGITHYPLAGSSNTYGTLNDAGWNRIEITYHLGAKNGQGLMSLRHRGISSSVWDTAFVNQPMGLVYANMDKKNPTTWNHFFGHFTGSASGLDNITIIKSTPNAPPTAITLSNDSISENEPVNTFVGLLTTTDNTPNDSHTYSLVSGAGSADNGNFNISNDSLFTSVSFDYETQTMQKIRVKSMDLTGLFIEVPMTVYVKDVEEIGLDETKISVLNIYPNPTVESVSFQRGSMAGQNVEVSIFDLGGALLHKSILTLANENRIDLSKIQAGVYIISVRDEENKLFTTRVIKE